MMVRNGAITLSDGGIGSVMAAGGEDAARRRTERVAGVRCDGRDGVIR